jgi:type II secretion system protein G
MKTKGFTLIELLIVVAIIAILAAIAVPNFLEAQTRSKVSRTKADMRSIGTALESYMVDHESYPWYPYTGRTPPVHPMQGYTPTTLTTPVAYMTSLPKDPWDYGKDAYGVWENIYKLFSYETAAQWDSMYGKGGFAYQAGDMVKWMLLTGGPDGVWSIQNPPGWFHANAPEYFAGRTGALSGYGWYDPTNGTVSGGDIVCYGPGPNFEFPDMYRRAP